MTSRQLLLSKTDTLTDSEVAEVLEYIGIMESLRDQQAQHGLDEDTVLVAWARRFMPRSSIRQLRTLGVKGMGTLRI